MLNNENYFSAENNKEYMGSSQFKSFMDCEARTMAELNGAYQRQTTDALMFGSYVDAYFEGTLEEFKRNNPEIFTKKGELLSQYRHAEYIIDRVKKDELFMSAMSGEKQKIFTGNIAGVPFKIKVDSYSDKSIVDLKVVKDFELIWDDVKGVRLPFIEKWGYDIQGAIYQEIVYQNTGKKLPFYIAAATKEKESNFEVFWIDDVVLENSLELVKCLAPKYQALKDGKTKPSRCGKCAYCRKTKKLTAPINYLEYFGLS